MRYRRRIDGYCNGKIYIYIYMYQSKGWGHVVYIGKYIKGRDIRVSSVKRVGACAVAKSTWSPMPASQTHVPLSPQRDMVSFSSLFTNFPSGDFYFVFFFLLFFSLRPTPPPPKLFGFLLFRGFLL